MKSGSSRWLAGLALVIVVLGGVSIIIALLEGSGAAALLPEGTPEGTVHRYLLAIEDGQTDDAYAYLSPELQQDCDTQDFRESLGRFRDGRYSGGHHGGYPAGFDETDDMRVTLVDVREVEDRVEVQVRITRFRVSPPLGAHEYSYREGFVLKQTDGQWEFIDAPWPARLCSQAEKPLRPERLR